MSEMEEPRKCSQCGSEDVKLFNECYEDEHHEMIEAVLVCTDCGFVER